jgi:glycosidase
MFEFHVSRIARDTYRFDESLFVYDGRVIFADVRAARLFAAKINALRPRDKAVSAGKVYALGLLEEYRHAIVHAYRRQVNPRVLQDALRDLAGRRIDPETIGGTINRFLHDFPPVAVYKNLVTVDEYLNSPTIPSAREAALEELLLLRMNNLNRAAEPLKELFDDAPLARETAYLKIIGGLRSFFAAQPVFGPDRQNLIDLLIAPMLASPDSLRGQLEFIQARWGAILGKNLPHILGGLDLLREEEKSGGGGPGPSVAPTFGADSQAASLALFGAAGPGWEGPRPPDPEPELFSRDLDWMPRLVLVAKNIYVWLDQLSRKYNRSLHRLDHVPDEELDALRDEGLTGLWLIGVWERSRASRQIKQIMGNPEAVASAYSLYDYSVAADLGGEEALQNLKDRAGRRGIRLASDMVPNHMGIDSRWVIEHPDWFIGRADPPFPAYTFNGPDLSDDERVAIRIEDRYYDRTDAAVVFQRRDKWTRDARYIYHGNDGTSFPWNDTAQLDFLKPEVREAVIRTILRVARDFPIIRFDAAMTLAKRHFQRLWYPEPGTGGAIPSRSESAMSRADFNAAFPEEFWRELVDRIAAEAPDTLLLAEAFWLMEGYFVRTLGMHRVYNSAFMHMLRDEDNAKYRQVMKNTLEFDPEVLKRYVNFMNNPDERTAIDQFGAGDKYFGVCTMLATLPGLPMVGHGQIEGFTEKYGMEYRRAYCDESPREDLVERHRREIFPLFHRRALFAGVSHFLLFDFFKPEGTVDENVFAYANGTDGERALIVFHNKYAETRGWIRTSAAFAQKTGAENRKVLVRRTLAEGLNIPDDPAAWIVFRDRVTGLEYIRNARELSRKGLYLELAAYKYGVFTDFHEVPVEDREIAARIAAELDGKGVPNLEAAARDLWLRPIQAAFREMIDGGFLLEGLRKKGGGRRGTLSDVETAAGIEGKARRLAQATDKTAGRESGREGEDDFAAAVRRDFEAILRLPDISGRVGKSGSKTFQDALRYLKSGLAGPAAGKKSRRRKTPPHVSRVVSGMDTESAWIGLFGWAAFRAIGRLAGERNPDEMIEKWQLERILAEALRDAGFSEADQADLPRIARALAGNAAELAPGFSATRNALHLAETIVGDGVFRRALRINEYGGIEYFNQEAFDALRWFFVATAALRSHSVSMTAALRRHGERMTAASSGRRLGRTKVTSREARTISRAFAAADRLRKAERQSGFETAKLLDFLKTRA